jgi:hypothetical protein
MMKTNVVITSKDRELFGITIRQETKTGFLSISDLQKAYEVAKWEHGWTDRSVIWIMQTNDFKERVFYLLENQGFINERINSFMERVENEGIAKTLKSIGVYKTTGARETKQVMANPYIWVLLAMELNPMIYAKVIIWLTDSLIFDRIEAGKSYSPMNDAIKKVLPNPEYYKYAIAINEKIFGKHFVGMRNAASAEELRKIARIEQFIISAIEMNMITNEEQIFNAIKTITV